MSLSKSAVIKIAMVASLIAFVLGIAFLLRTPNVAKVGGYPPDFNLPALNAGSANAPPIHLSEHRGHVVLVNFWATWCPPCIEETPSLQALSDNMRKLGVEVIGVSVDQDPAAIKTFVAEHHLSFPIVRDPDQRVASQYGTLKFPETYILDRDGRVAEKIIGATDWADPKMVSFVENLARPTKVSEGRVESDRVEVRTAEASCHLCPAGWLDGTQTTQPQITFWVGPERPSPRATC